MMIRINSFAELERSSFPNLLNQLKYIFYISSSIKEFKSDLHKDKFFQTWCGNYILFFPEQFFILYDEEQVLGYLSGCSNSLYSLDDLNIPGQALFNDLFEQFPAHLHINFHPLARNRGLGSRLVGHYCDWLLSQSILGVHLITSPTSQNVAFYKRLEFTFELIRDFNGKAQLFLGKKLSV